MDEQRKAAVKAFEAGMYERAQELRRDIEAEHGISLDFCIICGEGGIYHAFGKIVDEAGMGGALEDVIDDWDDPLFTAAFGLGPARPS